MEEKMVPLTTRQLRSVIGGILGNAVTCGTTVSDIREAVRWWATNEEAWGALEAMSANRAHLEALAESLALAPDDKSA